MSKGGFPGMGGNIQQLARQAQRMQQDIQKAQAEINAKEFEVTVGGGAVKVVIMGDKTFKSIIIDKGAVDPDDVEMLQDLVISAANEAVRTAQEAMDAAVEKVTGGVNLGF